jgi:hypothetical protein
MGSDFNKELLQLGGIDATGLRMKAGSNIGTPTHIAENADCDVAPTLLEHDAVRFFLLDLGEAEPFALHARLIERNGPTQHLVANVIEDRRQTRTFDKTGKLCLWLAR